MAGFDILNIVGEPWNDALSTFGGIALSVTDTASESNSTFLDCMLDGVSRFTVWKTGETYITHPSGTVGGFGSRGGAMALTCRIDPNTGIPADVIRYAWEGDNVGSHPDSVAVIRGMGNNRLSIESNGTIVHIANNGRYEFETATSGTPIQMVGYSAASSIGRPFLFTNHGQTEYADSVLQVGVDNAAQIASQWGVYNGSSFTANAYIDGSGSILARSLLARSISAYGAPGSYRGVAARSSDELTARTLVGLDPDNNGFIGFGPGNSALDSFIYRAGPNLFSIGGSAAADRPAIKGMGTAIQGRLADDSDFCTVQGKLTTDQMAVSESVNPNATLTLYDASGTAYKVPCLAA